MSIRNTNHFVSVDDLGDGEVSGLLDAADACHDERPRGALANTVVAPLFFQPSTRTRLGFETAALRLGASVAGFADPNSSRASAATQESYEDTIRTVSAMADLIVVRSGIDQGGRLAASLASCPVINAGDEREHPSQALIDAFTMRRLLREDRGMSLDSAHVGFTGCTSNRCTTPLLKLLARLGVPRISFLVEPGRSPDAAMLAGLRTAGASVRVTESLDDVLADCDVVSATPRDTRFTRDATKAYEGDATAMPASHVITGDAIRRTGSRAFIMHPLPRRNEISTCVDHLPNAAYFRQVAFSIPVRMAIYARVANILPGNAHPAFA